MKRRKLLSASSVLYVSVAKIVINSELRSHQLASPPDKTILPSPLSKS